MSHPEQEFQAAIAAAGLIPPDQINGDGKLHRFSSDGRRGDDAGWYVLHPDGIAAGMFGCWRTGLQSTWCAKSDHALSPTEREAQRQRIHAMQAQRDADKLAAQEAAAHEAARRWQAATPVTAHHYLSAKGVRAHGVRVDNSGALLIPMRDAAGKLWNVERINPVDSSDKRGLPGGKRSGLYHSIGKPDGRLIVCEGYATGASIHEATGMAVAVAFSAGNLEAAARALCAKYPSLQIILAADDDHGTDGNPGRHKANAAALAVGGAVAVPVFGDERPEKATDFNDLHQIRGAGAVRQCIESASTAEPTKPADWPDPQPLIAQHAPEPYPLDALPPAVRLAVEEVAGFVKAPVPLIASSALAALSLAIQALHDVQRAAKLQGPTGLFLLAVADSGERKSTCDGFFTKAIRDYEAKAQEEAKPKLVAYKSAHDAWEARRSGLKEKIKSLAKEGKPSQAQERELRDLDSDEPMPPRVPRLIYGDATPEALAYSLAKVWPSGGIVSSEAGSVFGSHGMGKDSAMRNMAMLNLLWDGADLPVERRSSESFTVRGARLTMALKVQEATLRAFFDNSKGLARGTGFLARFLIAWPESTQGTRNFTEPPESWPHLADFNQQLARILSEPVPMDDSGALSPAMLTLAPEAKAVWIAFHDAIEGQLSSGGDLHDVKDVASKTADNATRLAAMFHVFGGHLGPIGADAMESGARIAAWHLTEARRFFGELAMPVEIANPMRLEAWLRDYCAKKRTESVPTRVIQRSGPPGLREKIAIDAAIKELADLGRARPVQEVRKKLVQINPAILAGLGNMIEAAP